MKYIYLMTGYWHYLWGNCPGCGGVLPWMNNCRVCCYPRAMWWAVYKRSVEQLFKG